MRQIKGFKPGAERLYIPEAFDNRKDPDPVRIWLTEPTEGQKRDINSGHNVVDIPTGEDGKPLRDESGDIIVKMDVGRSWARSKEFVLRFVVRVENYNGRDGPILSGADLVNHGESEIVGEVSSEIEDTLSLTEDESKNSDAPSGCSRAATGHLSATAENASDEVKTSASTVTVKPLPDSDTSPGPGTPLAVAQSPG